MTCHIVLHLDYRFFLSFGFLNIGNDSLFGCRGLVMATRYHT